MTRVACAKLILEGQRDPVTNIYVMDSDGSNVVQLTNLRGFAGVPRYSPNARLIVFQWRQSNDFRDPTKWRICMMNSDGSNFHVITQGEANDQVPNWSRDSKRLLPTGLARIKSTR